VRFRTATLPCSGTWPCGASWSDSGDDHFYDDASLNSSVSDDQALTLSSFFKLAGGQLSRRIPSDRPREARTSLISVRDFLPRFGVLSSSTALRWIRSSIWYMFSAFRQLAELTVSYRSSTGRSRIGSFSSTCCSTTGS